MRGFHMPSLLAVLYQRITLSVRAAPTLGPMCPTLLRERRHDSVHKDNYAPGLDGDEKERVVVSRRPILIQAAARDQHEQARHQARHKLRPAVRIVIAIADDG